MKKILTKILKNWNIKPGKIRRLKSANPLSRSREWLVNDAFVLKAQPTLPDIPLLRILLSKGVPILVPKDWKSVKHEGLHYMVFDYAGSDRIDYPQEPGKAAEIAEALAKIASVDTGIETVDLIENLTKIVHRTRPIEVQKAFLHIRDRLFPYLGYFEQRFSHGDFHPSNILYKDGPRIIDWEIAAKREELYDLAFLVGCIGMDHPSELQGDFVIRLIKGYAEKAKPAKLSAVMFPELVLATRIEWMPIWAETKDEEMIDLEATFIDLILCNVEKLRKFWLDIFGDCKYSKNSWVMQDAHLNDEIIKAHKRLKNSDISVLSDQKPVERSSTDIRLLAIDSGMNDDITGVIRALEIQKKLSASHQTNIHLQIELGLTMGNSTLDFAKFRMKRSLDRIIREYHELVKKDIAELSIGFSFVLRNTSIFYAEIGDIDKMMNLVEEQIHFAKDHPHIEIQGELARTLSNAIATLLPHPKKHKIDSFFSMLLELKQKYPESEKIDAAYRIAETNMLRYSV